MAYCERCDRSFQYWSSYQQHIRDSPNHHVYDDEDEDEDSWHTCPRCGEDFEDDEELTRHLNDEHYYCKPCDRYFQSWSSRQQHLADSSNHHLCGDCNEDFDSWRALKQHYIQSPRHHCCRECGTDFEDNDELTTHCIDDHHYCDTCDQFFQSALGLQEHNRQSHLYCTDCNRFFISENNLREHMNSSVHRPKDIPCPFQRRGCTRWFISRSAMISHLENGACPSGANRPMIDKWIRRNDPHHVVTVPLLTDGSENRRYIATERSWNNSVSAYECVLCHRIFGTLDALNGHLASPRHSEKIYHCPLSTCRRMFPTLSGLCRHVESESCGVLRFKAVQEGMENLLGNMGRLRIQGE